MPPERIPEQPRRYLHARPPPGWRIRRELPLPEDSVHHLEHKVVLIFDVPVERHGGDPYLGCDAAHRDRAEPLRVGDRDTSSNDSLGAQPTFRTALPPRGRRPAAGPPISFDH